MGDRKSPPPPKKGMASVYTLIILIGVLGGLLAWQRKPKPDPWAEARQAALAQQQLAAIEGTDPLSAPDFLGEPAFAPTATQEEKDALYRSARNSLIQVEVQKRSRSAKTPNRPYSVPNSAQSPTNQQHLDRYFRYRQRELVAYEQHTSDKAAAKDACVKFLRAYLAMVCERTDAPSRATVKDLADAAIKAGTQDPLVRSYIAYMNYQETGDVKAAESVWAEAVRQLPKTQYPRIVSVFIRFFAHEVARDEGMGRARNRHTPLLVAIVKWLEEETADGQWLDCTFTRLLRLRNDNNGELRVSIAAACAASPRIDAAIVHALLGDEQVRTGWAIRGSGWAKDVPAENWGRVDDHLSKAAAHLQYAWMLRPDEPYFSSRLIFISQAGYDNTYRPYDWFLRSTEARLDYWDSYTQLLQALRPRWGGSLKSMQEFTESCLETDRFDTFIPYAFLDFIPDIQRMELEDDPTQLAQFKPRSLLLKCLDRRNRYQQAHPEAKLYGDSWYYRTRLGLMLEDFGLPAEAVAEFRAADGNIDTLKLQEDNRPGMHLLRRLHAAQGNVRERVLAFDESLRTRWPADTPESAFDALDAELADLRETATDQWARDYYSHAAAMLQQLRAYARGEWVSLTFANGGHGWEVRADEYDCTSERDELLLNRRHGITPQVWARPLAYFAPPFAVEAVIEHMEGNAFLGPFGFRWTCPSEAYKDQEEYNALYKEQFTEPFVSVDVTKISRSDSFSEFASFTSSKEGYTSRNWTRNAAPGPRHVQWKLWPQAYEAVFERNWRSDPLPYPLKMTNLLSIGEPRSSHGSRLQQLSGSARISRVRIRKLSLPQPPDFLVTPLEERESYWQARLEFDANDPIAASRMCAIRLEQGRYDEVLERTHDLLQRWPGFDNVRKYAGRALFKQGRYRDAERWLNLAIEEPFDDALVYGTLGEIRAAAPQSDLRNGREAVNLAGMGARQSGMKHVVAVAAFAAAQAELGDFDQARQLNRQAIELTDEEPFKLDLQQRQVLYEANQPFRLPVLVDEPISVFEAQWTQSLNKSSSSAAPENASLGSP